MERNTRIRASQIRSILPSDIEAINSVVDNYVPRKASGQDKFEWVEQGSGGGTGGYTASFVNTDISSAGILVVNHNLNSTYPLVIIYDNNNLAIDPDEIEYKTANQIEIDLSSFIPITGTWNIRVNSGGSSISNIEDLGDVDFDSGTPGDNYIIRYDSASGKWKAEALSTDHNDATNIQGGTANEYYHLTSADYTELSQWLDNVTLGNDGKITLSSGTDINEFSIDGTLAGDSDDAVPTEKAVKTYVDTAISGISTDKIEEGDSSVEVVDVSGDISIKFKLDNVEQIRLEDGVLYPITNNDIDLGSSSKKFKDGYFSGKLTVDGLIDPTGLVLNAQAVNPMGSGQEGIWIDSNDSKLYHFDGTTDKEILNEDHTDTYNHTNIHEVNKDTYLAFGTVDQVSAGDTKDAVDKKHTQNSDTKLDDGEANETTASELRTALDTTIPGKANKVSGGIEDNFMSIDNLGHPKDSGQKDSDYADAVHDHDADYLALDNTDPFTPDADYEPATKKYVDDALVGGGFGDMFKNIYDTDNDGIVDYAEALSDGGTGNEVNYTDVQDAVDKKHIHSNKALLDTYDQTNANITDAISKKHTRQHAIDGTSDHTSSITPNNLIDADANGLPDDSGLAVSDVSDAVSKKHSQNTDTGTNQDTFSIGDGTEDAHKLIEANVGQSGTQPGIRYNKDTDTWQISNDGSTWEDIEAGTGSGDMLKSTYDTDADGIVDKAESIDDGVYSATAEDIADAITKEHTHSNKALLDTYTQTEIDIADAISKEHTRQHAIDSTSDHTSSITQNNLIDADANGLPDDSGLSVTDVSDAVSKKHTQNTDIGTSSDDFAVGDGTDTDKTVSANIGQSGDQPAIKYDATLDKWRFSNDGSTFQDFGTGGTLTVKAVDNDPTVNNVSEIQIDESTGLTLTDIGGGVAKIGLGSHWKDLEIDGQSTLTPSGEETLEFEAGSGIAITTNSGSTPKKITISASGSAVSYRTSFDNGDLSSGILTVTHSLNQKYVGVSVYNNNDIKIVPDNIELKTVNSLEVDLSGFGTIAGEWNIVVLS